MRITDAFGQSSLALINEKEGIEADFKQILEACLWRFLASFGKKPYINWLNLLVFWPLLVFPPCH